MTNQRIYKVANFLAFNLLFFALYLNFIRQDAIVSLDNKNSNHSTIQRTTLIENPAVYLNKAAVQPSTIQQTMAVNEKSSTVKFN